MSEYTGPSEFVLLHCHSLYSSLDGCISPQQYAEECHKRGYPAMTVTEHGHMASVPDMYFAAKKYGIKYFSGCEIYFCDYEPLRQKLVNDGIKIRSKQWREENPELYQRVARSRHLTLLAKNQTGHENLIKLTTQAYKTGLYSVGGRSQFNRVWFDKLCEFKEGVIVLSGCLNGPICHELRFRNIADKEGNIVFERNFKQCLADAYKWVKKFHKEFGEDYYIELQMPGIENDDEVFRQSVAIADFLKIPTVLTTDTHYLERKDFIIQKIMMAVAQDLTVDSKDLFHVNSDEQYMKSRAELWDTYKNNPYSNGLDNKVFEDSCNNTLLIADRCEAFKADSTPKIPEIPNADGELTRQVSLAIIERGLHKITEKFVIDGREVTYVEQAKLELDRFISKGVSSYFLITADLIGYSKKNAWPHSPRGSAGGSLVCFLLGIHTLDPMLWGLSFDRFMSPSRGGYMLNLKME